MRPDDPPLIKRVEHRPSFRTQGMRRTNHQIAPEESLGLCGHGAIHMGGKQRYADQRADTNGDTDEEIQEVPPGSSGLPPGHAEHEAVHRGDSLRVEMPGRISSDSMRPSRSAITRCIKVAMAWSWAVSYTHLRAHE